MAKNNKTLDERTLLLEKWKEKLDTATNEIETLLEEQSNNINKVNDHYDHYLDCKKQMSSMKWKQYAIYALSLIAVLFGQFGPVITAASQPLEPKIEPLA